ncbi:thiol:disulfide interchange protein DsbA/DsbL [Roseivirga sp. E12]|uniref:thiol:disulfide interchange protein DsbA/DsbL n=1 Tax=Roseivirga sp. E12 TaxID=2819237 RepID=UPI001ABCD0A7|nr:thiol:disulfide interchange protein DsbA/DsbL [Roseivirga sp. E12]MBO3700128.1 thiol:disulfide interchange protein DsbA/DsbL [Roseivirga sp. E12]
MRILTICLVLTLTAVSLQAQKTFQEGKHYEVVSQEKSMRIQVTEFFSLFCGHCFQFEALVDTLEASLGSEAIFRKSHVDYLPRDNEKAQFDIVKAFVTMGELDMEKELTRQFFAAIHAKGMKMDTPEEIKKIFLANDVNEVEFDRLFNGEEVEYRAKEMAKLWEEKKVTNVPTLVVNGMYKIEMGSVRSLQELIDLTNYLLAK